MIFMRTVLTLVAITVVSVVSGTTSPEELPEVLASGPWNNVYSASDAANTHTWIKVRSEALTSLQTDERLRLWVQWAPGLDGPWKTKAKGEIEVRPKKVPAKPQEHPRLRSRAYVHKSSENDDIASLEMGPLSRPIQQPLPYFRVAQTLRVAGEQRKRTPRIISRPEDNDGVFSKPFQGQLGIILAYRLDPAKKHVPPPHFDSTEVWADQPGPWTSLSFKQGCRSYVSFFVGLGGINYASIVPAQPFEVYSSAGHLEFWSCHPRPKNYRPEQGQVKALDTQWWGICPVRVPIPAPGEFVEVEIHSTLFNHDYSKVYRVFGQTPTPEKVARRKVNQTQYRLVQALLDPTTASPVKNPKDLAIALLGAQGAFQSVRELYRSGEPSDFAVALGEAYITLLELQHQDRLLRARLDEESRLANLLASASLALALQKWEEALVHLDTYYDAVIEYEKKGVLSPERSQHYLQDPLPIRSLEPFAAAIETASFIDLLKQWAWTMSDPTIYKHALTIKAGPTTPQEYQELAELVVERTGNRDAGESLWRKGNDLITSLDSPFHHSDTTEKMLKAERPGWWSE